MDVRCDRLAATNAAHLLQSPLTHQPLSRRNTHALVTIAAVSRLTAPPPVPIPSSASAAAATSDGAVMVTLAAARCRMAVPAEWVRGTNPHLHRLYLSTLDASVHCVHRSEQRTICVAGE
jgi:hypothetical protein